MEKGFKLSENKLKINTPYIPLQILPMIEENKHYTPSVEELHAGCEYEHINSLGELEKQMYVGINTLDYFVIKKRIDDNKLKIKYLDQKDIEELGWKQVKENNYQYFHNDKDFYELTKEGLQIKIELFKEIEFCVSNCFTKFEGKIKNKSELKKLMKQLDIE